MYPKMIAVAFALVAFTVALAGCGGMVKIDKSYTVNLPALTGINVNGEPATEDEAAVDAKGGSLNNNSADAIAVTGLFNPVWQSDTQSELESAQRIGASAALSGQGNPTVSNTDSTTTGNDNRGE